MQKTAPIQIINLSKWNKNYATLAKRRNIKHTAILDFRVMGFGLCPCFSAVRKEHHSDRTAYNAHAEGFAGCEYLKRREQGSQHQG